MDVAVATLSVAAKTSIPPLPPKHVVENNSFAALAAEDTESEDIRFVVEVRKRQASDLRSDLLSMEHVLRELGPCSGVSHSVMDMQAWGSWLVSRLRAFEVWCSCEVGGWCILGGD